MVIGSLKYTTIVNFKADFKISFYPLCKKYLC